MLTFIFFCITGSDIIVLHLVVHLLYCHTVVLLLFLFCLSSYSISIEGSGTSSDLANFTSLQRKSYFFLKVVPTASASETLGKRKI
jgi:hypothetical protein